MATLICHNSLDAIFILTPGGLLQSELLWLIRTDFYDVAIHHESIPTRLAAMFFNKGYGRPKELMCTFVMLAKDLIL